MDAQIALMLGLLEALFLAIQVLTAWLAQTPNGGSRVTWLFVGLIVLQAIWMIWDTSRLVRRLAVSQN